MSAIRRVVSDRLIQNFSFSWQQSLLMFAFICTLLATRCPVVPGAVQTSFVLEAYHFLFNLTDYVAAHYLTYTTKAHFIPGTQVVLKHVKRLWWWDLTNLSCFLKVLWSTAGVAIACLVYIRCYMVSKPILTILKCLPFPSWMSPKLWLRFQTQAGMSWSKALQRLLKSP